MTKHTFNNIITYVRTPKHHISKKFRILMNDLISSGPPWYKDKLLRIFSFASAGLRAIWAQDLIIIPIICNSPHPSTFLYLGPGPILAEVQWKIGPLQRNGLIIKSQPRAMIEENIKNLRCSFNPCPGPDNIVKECEKNELNKNYCSFQHILKIFAISDSFHLNLFRAGSLTHWSWSLISIIKCKNCIILLTQNSYLYSSIKHETLNSKHIAGGYFVLRDFIQRPPWVFRLCCGNIWEI